MEVDGIFYSRSILEDSFNYTRIRGIIEFLETHDEIPTCYVCRYSIGAPGSVWNKILGHSIEYNDTDRHWMKYGYV